MTKNTIWKLALVLVLFPAAAFAQAPFSAGSGPVITASVGYSYLNVPIPSATRIGLNGLGASITADFPSRFGAKIDLNYARAANVFGTGHHSDVLSYMIGPMFYPVSNKRMAVYVQALAGGSRADGVIPNGAGGFDIVYTEGFAWAIGAGVERSISSTLSVRTETDYMNTSTIDSSGAFRGQSDLRVTGSLVYRWDWHSEGRRGRHRF
jgi:opacity protein-like surface antigen